MEPRILRLLKRHHVLTLATTSAQGSWTAHCFYAVLPDRDALVFTSDPKTRHGREMLGNPEISGGISLETKAIGMIRGIQLTGRSIFLENCPEVAGYAEACRNAYLMRFPFALASKLDLWILFPDYIKMTDNRLGFGTKLEWRRDKPITADCGDPEPSDLKK